MRRAETTAHALAERCEEVAAALLGPQTSTTKQELRFGRRGSFALCRNAAKRGLWYDHERGDSHASMELHYGTRSSLLSAITSALPSPRPGGWYDHPCGRGAASPCEDERRRRAAAFPCVPEKGTRT